jgi:3-hydroxyisobutyrate dehydrogenase-like beta-hydroxyacid dehydrogenase
VTAKCIGILYPGEMGSCFGAMLMRHGYDVITTVEGRGSETVKHCREAGLRVVETLADVVTQAPVVWSFVPPDAARELADRFVAALPPHQPSRLYIDANSTAPDVAEAIADLMHRYAVDFIDATIHGNAQGLEDRSVLYLSGAREGDVEEALRGVMRIRTLGPVPGAASRFKMTIAGLSKGLSALFMEVASVAHHQDTLGTFIEECRHFYPEVMHILETMLPTYARHSRRRTAELLEMERMVQALGLRPGLIAEARRLVGSLACHEADADMQKCARETPGLETFLDAVGAAGLLSHEDPEHH